jgi:hypothetical protein
MINEMAYRNYRHVCVSSLQSWLPPYLLVLTYGVCLLRGTDCIFCVLCESQNKQRLFHCTTLTDWIV